ncbi:MAG: colanic acid biosynthesis glycosyltransferase WcaL, partial [Proteobacteria bacterium]|nr:colanic acid biosynthesis glycosyltransferase WcaL [Pseudomonadota bacterium]
MSRPILPIVLKGYPRLSETFIAQEILELERLGFAVEIWSLRQPTDGAVHMMHKAIRAPLRYLPEYLYQGIPRVLAGAVFALGQPGLGRLFATFFRDLARDFS